MKRLLKYLLFLTLSLSFSASYGQFWRKKTHHTRTASNGVDKKRKRDKTKDSFKRKSKKGPNQKTTRKPFWRSKKNMHKHATSRKSGKGSNKKFHKKKRLDKSAFKGGSGTGKEERRSRKSKGDSGGSRGRKK